MSIRFNETDVNKVMKKFSLSREAAEQFILDGSFKFYCDTVGDVEDFEYYESKYPKDEGGKWTDGGGGGGTSVKRTLTVF